jgi:hypothetical protein
MPMSLSRGAIIVLPPIARNQPGTPDEGHLPIYSSQSRDPWNAAVKFLFQKPLSEPVQKAINREGEQGPVASLISHDLPGKQKRPVGDLLQRKPDIDTTKRCKAPADPLQARVGCSIAPPLPASERPAMLTGTSPIFGASS